MIGQKYHEDIARCRYIGELLNQRCRGITREQYGALAHLHSLYSGLVPGTSLLLIRLYTREGPSPREISSDSTNHPKFKGTAHLERLSIFYHLIHIPQEDEIVLTTQEVNPAFVYPPPERQELSDLFEKHSLYL